MRIASLSAFLVGSLVCCGGVTAQSSGYQKPPAAIEQLLDAPETPLVSVSPDRATLLIEQPASFPTIADVAQPRLRLAGIRFNPAASAPAGSSDSYNVSLKLQPVAGGYSFIHSFIHAFPSLFLSF